MENKSLPFRLLVLVTAMMCAIGASAYDFYTGGVYYTKLTSNTVEVAYNTYITADYSGNVTIPSTVTYGGVTYTVKGIGYCAFGECTQLTSVTLPNTLTYVGDLAFIRCSALTSITIPTGVTRVGNGTFEYCENLSSVNLPTTLKTIGNNAFLDCKALASIYLPASLESIGAYAFSRCNLEYVFCSAFTPPTMGNNVFEENTLNNATLVINNAYCKFQYANATGWSGFANVTAVNYYNFQVNGVYYCQNGVNTVAVSAMDDNYNSYSGRVTIPATVTYDNKTYTVTEVGPNAFRNCSNLTIVTLPNTVTKICDFAFAMCTSMSSPQLPSALSEIGNNAFVDIKFSSITFPNTLTKIGNYAFNGCSNLNRVDIPDNVTTIGASAFSSCTALKYLTIGSGCTSIGEWAFMECTSLISIMSYAEAPPTISYYTFRNNSGFTTAKLFMPYSAQEAYANASYWSSFTNTERLGFDFMLNDIYYRYTGDNTVGVAYKYSTAITYTGSVNIPAQVSHKGTNYNVTSITGEAFRNDRDVTSVTLPASIVRIENNAFENCTGLTAISIPSSVNYMGSHAFMDCSGLTRVNTSSIASWLGIQFVNELANPLVQAHDLYVSNSKLESLTIPSSVTQIKQHAFNGCTSIKRVTTHNQVTTVGSSAFKNCSSIHTVVIGAAVTSIQGNAFTGCTALNTINSWPTTPPTITSTTFDQSHYSNVTLSVPYSAKPAYKAANYWKNFTSYGDMYDFVVDGIYYIITNTGEVSVTRRDIYGEQYSGNLVIPETVTYNGVTYTVTGIYRNAFTACHDLVSLTIPATVTSVTHAFFNNMATGWTSITCLAITPPEGMTELNSDQYANITVTVPKNSASAYRAHAGWGLFANIVAMAYDFERDGLCYNITGSNAVEVTYRSTSYNSYSGEVTIPATVTLAGVTYNVTAVGASAFRNSSGLTSITFPTSVKSIGNYAFYQCTGLTGGLALKQGLESIGNYAFARCSGITSAIFPYSITSFGIAPFGWCTSLTQFLRTSQPHGEVEYVIQNGVVFNYFTNTLAIFPGGKTQIYTVPDGTVAIGAHAFRGSIVRAVNMPTSLRSISESAFANCESLTSIEVPKGVTAIGEAAFSNCTALTAVILPSTLQTLGGRAFYNDGALVGISCKATTPPTCQISSVGTNNFPPFDASHFQNARLRVPTGCKNAYKAAPIWKLFNSIVESSSLDEVTMGDVDGDGNVGIADVTALVDYILDHSNVIVADAADVDQDGNIGIADVTVLIDYILNGTW